MAAYLLKLWIYLFIVTLNTRVQGESSVNLTRLESAVAKGAVCLDGSPPTYAYLEGYGVGASNWIVFMEGGGWCESIHDCLLRSKGWYGSTYHRNKSIIFSGLLDADETFNPDFFNWHKAYVLYCDGSSFMSDVENVDPETNLTFRGARIFDVMMEEMLLKGMGGAQNVIFTGSSAGGLATILHCDKFRTLLPSASRVKCISDSGFFIHAEDQPGATLREQRFANVVATHELANTLPTSCTSKMNSSLCLFPENLVGDIQTPLFLVESAFDKWQIGENLIPAVGGKAEWENCTNNLTLCNSTELGIMKDFRTSFINTLQKLDYSPSRGMFVHSCYLHGQIWLKEECTCSSVAGNKLANKTIGQAIGDWYFDQYSFREIDTQNESPRNCTNTFNSSALNQKCLAALPHNGSKTNNLS